jgi:type II secretory pathway component PulJ
VTTARAEGGFTLFEVIVVMFLLAAIMGAVMTTLVGAERRFKRAGRAAEARAEVARAAERMVKDIRSACDAAEEKGALVLVLHGGERGGRGDRIERLERIEWRLADGHLVRKAPGDRSATRARLSGFRVKVEELAKEAGRSPFVEVGIEIEAPRALGRTTGPKPKGTVLYVGARPRAGGAM